MIAGTFLTCVFLLLYLQCTLCNEDLEFLSNVIQEAITSRNFLVASGAVKLVSGILNRANDPHPLYRDLHYQTWDVVVAHCKEDLFWLSDIILNVDDDVFVNIILYEKCGEEHPPLDGIRYRLRSFQLKNVGEEAYAYLYHIVSFYDELADLTMFLQGDGPRESIHIREHVREASELLLDEPYVAVYGEPEGGGGGGRRGFRMITDHYITFDIQTGCPHACFFRTLF
eukprot:Rmarinus@m.14284